MRNHILSALAESQASLAQLVANDATISSIESAAECLVAAFRGNHRAFSCGNGGSMSDAMHFAEELTGRYRRDRPPLPAMAISDPAHLSCVANDFGYDAVFSRYIEAHGSHGDVVLAISTSGRSANVLAAARAAREREIKVIALVGVAGSPLSDLADITICTPGGKFADRVQELHIKVIHIILELIERALFPQNYEA